MNQLIEIVRNLFRPIMIEVVPPYEPLPGKILLPIVDEYEPLTGSEIDNAWASAKKYGLSEGPFSASAHLPPITTACTTAMDFDYPVHQMTELKYEPLAEWVCQWCGNMWTSDITSCEKCGGPKEETARARGEYR